MRLLTGNAAMPRCLLKACKDNEIMFERSCFCFGRLGSKFPQIIDRAGSLSYIFLFVLVLLKTINFEDLFPDIFGAAEPGFSYEGGFLVGNCHVKFCFVYRILQLRAPEPFPPFLFFFLSSDWYFNCSGNSHHVRNVFSFKFMR